MVYVMGSPFEVLRTVDLDAVAFSLFGSVVMDGRTAWKECCICKCKSKVRSFYVQYLIRKEVW